MEFAVSVHGAVDEMREKRIVREREGKESEEATQMTILFLRRYSFDAAWVSKKKRKGDPMIMRGMQSRAREK